MLSHHMMLLLKQLSVGECGLVVPNGMQDSMQCMQFRCLPGTHSKLASSAGNNCCCSTVVSCNALYCKSLSQHSMQASPSATERHPCASCLVASEYSLMHNDQRACNCNLGRLRAAGGPLTCSTRLVCGCRLDLGCIIIMTTFGAVLII